MFNSGKQAKIDKLERQLEIQSFQFRDLKTQDASKTDIIERCTAKIKGLESENSILTAESTALHNLIQGLKDEITILKQEKDTMYQSTNLISELRKAEISLLKTQLNQF